MKIRIFLFLLSLIALCFKSEAHNNIIQPSPGDTLIVICSMSDTLIESDFAKLTCKCVDSVGVCIPNPQNEDVSALTLAVNSANNVLTGETIIVGILTLLVAILGLFGYKRFTEKLEETKKEAENLKKKNENIEKIQSLNNQYLQSINQRILNNADAIAEAIGEKDIERGMSLKEKSMVNYYVMELFLSKNKKEIDDCINYIKTQGGKEVIGHLQFIIDNDPDEYKRNKASEAIGYIKRGIQ